MAGSLRHRGGDTWQLRVSAGKNHTTGRYDEVTRTFRGTEARAKRELAKLVAEVDAGKITADNCTVAALMKRWLAHVETRERAPTTLKNYQGWSKRVIRDLGPMQVRKLRGDEIDGFLARVTIEAGASTSEHTYRMMRAAFRQAVRWGLVDRAPTDRATPPTIRRAEPKAPTADEVSQLIAGAAEVDPSLAVLIRLAAVTGLRRGELCGLQWGDVDLEAGQLVIRHAVSRTKGQTHVRGTKTYKVHQIRVDAGTIKALDQQYRRALHQCRQIEAPELPLWVFSLSDDYSEPMSPDSVTGAFTRLRASLGLDHVRFHHLRHWAATVSLAGGFDARTVAGRLGHSPVMTLATYAHVVEANDQALADMLGRALNAGPEVSSSARPARTPKNGEN